MDIPMSMGPMKDIRKNHTVGYESDGYETDVYESENYEGSY